MRYPRLPEIAQQMKKTGRIFLSAVLYFLFPLRALFYHQGTVNGGIYPYFKLEVMKSITSGLSNPQTEGGTPDLNWKPREVKQETNGTLKTEGIYFTLSFCRNQTTLPQVHRNDPEEIASIF